MGKFDSKSDDGIFLEYFTSSKAYRVFNKRTMMVEESMHVSFIDINDVAPRKLDDETCILLDALNKVAHRWL